MASFSQDVTPGLADALDLSTDRGRCYAKGERCSCSCAVVTAWHGSCKFWLAFSIPPTAKRGFAMADDKRNRPEQPPSGKPGPDRPGSRDRKPGGGMESPNSDRARREDEEEPQE
jgi:hypothetical protein